MNVEIKEIDLSTAEAFKNLHEAALFPTDVVFECFNLLDALEKQKSAEVDAMHKGGLKINYGVFLDGKMIGFHLGRQMERGMFHMGQSGILPEFQKRGFYSQLLQFVLHDIEKRGFQGVSSRHNATNNAIIVPKLKAGFLIAGFEISDVVGLQLRLVYYFNETRRQVHHFRTGRQGLPTAALPVTKNYHT